jgi:hypothetical protein
VNLAVELGVADSFQKRGELRAGLETVANEVAAVDERGWIEALGRPGESFAAERDGRVFRAGDGCTEGDELGGAFVREEALELRPT